MKRTVRATGLQRILRKLYYGLLFAVGSDVVTAEVGDVSARFEVESLSEKGRVSNVPGPGRPTLSSLIDDIRDDDVFYEVGANIGVISCLVGDRIDDGHVVAFEPHPTNVSRLEFHLENNDVPASVYSLALSDEEGQISLAIESPDVGAGGHSIAGADNGETLTVETKQGDTLVEAGEISSPTVVYIDAEGAELRVIRGIRQQLKLNRCRLIHCSVHATTEPGASSIRNHGHTPEELHEELEALGFTLETVETPGSENYTVIGRKDDPGH